MATQYVGPDAAVASASAADQTSTTAEKRYLIGPVADFLCFGGSALIILPLLLLLPAVEYKASFAAATMLLAHFVNHPHFGHSFQIFYRGFGAKAFSPALGRAMQLRYLFAGVAVPVLLAIFFAVCIVRADLQSLGYAANAMALFVGWHYVKQGYGLLMVDATLKRQFFTAQEKKVLLLNSYAVWATAWMLINDAIAKDSLWGISYFSFNIPQPIVIAAATVALATSGATAWMLFTRWRRTGGLPVNGVIAYFVSLYPWLLFIWVNPLWMLVTPALHSLQYLAVVWRFQINYERAQLAQPGYKAGSIDRRLFGSNPFGHLALFVLAGSVLGFAGFWALPTVLPLLVSYDEAIFGGTLYLFVAWIFINVHHYFIDNVIWRRENPDTKRYLFD